MFQRPSPSTRRQLWVVRTEDTAFEQRASLKARGYRWDDGEGKRVRAWWLMTNHTRAELDWLRADIYGDDREISVLKAPATALLIAAVGWLTA